jgi:A/G-specific adenine glycosylase
MLQQTQVAAVVPYYTRFLARFPDLSALAAAPVEDVLAHWSGLGYYRRAHHLHAAARAVVARHAGAFPRDVAAIATLPGVGRSTAAAIAAFAFGARAAILDGNVKRVLARHGGIAGFPGEVAVERALWTLAEALLPGARGPDIARYTQALMDLGATVCTRARPACDRCPVAADCVALRSGRVAELPTPRPKKPLPQRALRVLLVEHAGAVLLERRPPAGIWGGLWSLPELALDADVDAYLHRRFGVRAARHAELPAIAHGFTHYALTLHPLRVAVARWPLAAYEPGTLWLPPADAQDAALPAPIKKLLRSLAPG